MIADRDDVAEGGPATDDAFEWTESRYDTRVVLEAPEAMVYGRVCVPHWRVELTRSRDQSSAVFTLVLPRAFSGDFPVCFPWDA